MIVILYVYIYIYNVTNVWMNVNVWSVIVKCDVIVMLMYCVNVICVTQ